jgi:hypothetical protein
VSARHLRLIVLSLGVAVTLPSHAQATAEDHLRDQLRQTTLQLRQALDDNADLKAKLDQLGAQQAPAAPAPKPPVDEQAAALRRNASAQAAQIAALQQELDASKQSLAQWQKGYQDAAEQSRSRGADAKKFEAQFQDADHRAAACSADNAQLVQISNELLERYKNKGVWSTIADRELLTGIHRVELEKAAQDYHARIVDSTVQPSNQSAPSESQH